MKNRSAIASSILTNGDMLQKVKEYSENSEGSAMAENDKYLQSVNGQVVLLKANLQNLWSDAIDSNALAFFVQIGSTLVKMVDNVGLFKAALLGITGVASLKGAGRANLHSCPSILKMPADLLLVA